VLASMPWNGALPEHTTGLSHNHRPVAGKAYNQFMFTQATSSSSFAVCG